MAAISATTYTGPFTGNGVTTAFAADFTVASASEIEVQLDGAVVSPSLYSVALNASNVPTVTFNTAPSGQVLLVSSPAWTQDTQYENEGAYSLSSINETNRRQAIRANVLRRTFDRALITAVGETGFVLPAKANRANLVIGFNANGDFALVNPTSNAVVSYYDNTLIAGLNRTIKVPTGETGPTLPAAASRANKVFGFDASGAPTMLGSALNAVSGYLTNEVLVLPALSDGTVTSYAGATGSFKIMAGSTDVSSNFTLSTFANPQSLTVGYVNRTYTITAGLDAGEANATLTIRATGSGTYAGVTVDKVLTVGKSGVGIDAKTMTVLCSTQTITYDALGAASPSVQTNTFSVNKQNTTATVNWSIVDANGVARTPVTSYLSNATGDSVTMTEAQFATARNGTSGITVTATLTDGVTITDKISVVRVQAGANAINTLLTNEAVTVAADSAGTVASFAAAGGNFKIYLGNTDVSASATYAVFSSSGVTISINASTGAYSVSAMSADNATATLRATYGGNTYDRIYSISKSRAGVVGNDGLHNAPVTIYRRAATTPTLPSATTTYTFSTGVLSGLNNGWTQAVPAVDGNPLYVTQALASSNTATDTILSSEWASPIVVLDVPYNSATVLLYRRTGTNVAPSVPSTTSTYTFATGILTGHNNSWTQSAPAPGGGGYLWQTQAMALSNGSTDTILTGEWAAPNLTAQDGANGTDAIFLDVTRPSLNLFTYADGTVVSFANATGILKLMQGQNDITANAGVTLSASATNCTGTINTALNTPVSGQAKGYYQVTAMSADEASLNLSAVYNGVTYTTTISLTKTKAGYEIVGTLPATNLFEGRTVFLTTDGKLYRYHSGAWITAVAATDITGQLTDAQLAAIAAAKLTGQITTTQIADDGITTPKIAAGAVVSANIAADTITAANIAANAVTATELAAGAVTTPKIDAGAVTANEISAGAITAAKLAASNVITLSAQIANGVIQTANIADAQITTAKIQDAQVTTLKIGANQVTVPLAISSATPVSGNGTYQTILSSSITLAQAGVLFALFTSRQGYSASLPQSWDMRLKFNGSTVSTAGGSGGYTDSPSTSGSASLGAGTHTVALEWYGQGSGLTLYNNSLFAQGAMR